MKPFLVAKDIPTKPEGFLSELGTAAPLAKAIRNIQVAKSTATSLFTFLLHNMGTLTSSESN